MKALSANYTIIFDDIRQEIDKYRRKFEMVTNFH